MQLNQKGIAEYTLKEVINKIKKLRLKYKCEKDKTRKSGNGAGKKWKYFDAMDRFLAQRPSVTPLAVNDTFALNEDASSSTTMTEIDCGNKNCTFTFTLVNLYETDLIQQLFSLDNMLLQAVQQIPYWEIGLFSVTLQVANHFILGCRAHKLFCKHAQSTNFNATVRAIRHDF